MASLLAAALIVTMFAVSGVMHLVGVFRCDKNILAKLLRRAPCDWLVSALLVGAGTLEIAGAGAIVASYHPALSASASELRQYAAIYLMAFTALVTALFKVPRLFSAKPLAQRLIPILSNITTFGALLAIYEGAP